MSAYGRQEYGLVYGDGEIEFPFDSLAEAAAWRNRARAEIKAGRWNVGDYEPMTIVMRRRVTTVTDWSDVG